MVKKYMYELRGPYPSLQAAYPQDAENCRALVAANDSLHATLNICKNQISRHHHSRRWDQCKRFTNEYELVFTSSAEFPGVVSHAPISRSFFKLWELLHDVPELASRDAPMKAAFVAEGPGGFIESFIRYRSARRRHAAHQPCDQLHGMTLISRHKNVPGWKVQGAAGVVLHRGADGTGDLYRLANIDALCNEVGEGTCDLVTADGGFDFSGDFNNQEDASLRLLLCEVYAATRLQRAGGAFVLKVYDVHSLATMRLLYALRECYARMRITKPLTSRPANSEKYVLCTGFVRCGPTLLSALRAACSSGGAPAHADAALRDVFPRIPASFLRDLVHFNAVYITRQMCYIGRTILMIQETGAQSPAGGEGNVMNAATLSMDTAITVPAIRASLRDQLCKSIRWCHKYRIPASLSAMGYYRRLG